MWTLTRNGKVVGSIDTNTFKLISSDSTLNTLYKTWMKVGIRVMTAGKNRGDIHVDREKLVTPSKASSGIVRWALEREGYKIGVR